MGDAFGTAAFGSVQFGGLLFLILPPPPPPPPPYIDSPDYFRTDIRAEGFKRRYTSGSSTVTVRRTLSS